MGPVRILHLEDSPEDGELVRHLLIQEGIACDITSVDDRERFGVALEEQHFDLIFADCTVPGFSGLRALEMARVRAPDVPFIFVSGTIDENAAIDSLRNGATDYVLKDRISRLVPAVRRALAESDERSKAHEMSQRLREAQRLEAIGTLAVGVAHDFNNILTIIRGHVSLLALEQRRTERVGEIAATIDRASARGSELVNQLLAFARRSEGSFTATDVNLRIREVAAMLRPSLGPGIAFVFQLEENLPQIHADAGQLDRVLINLATNARDAMPDGGTITFSTRRVRREDVPHHGRDPMGEQYVCLDVADTGCGMDEATRQRIFEPFFTTKPRGKGTGLGMPVVYGLMQSHHGFVDVTSNPGAGTSVALYFPVPNGPPLRTAPAQAEPRPVVDGTETVLVVDDEPDIRYLLEVMLESHGYKVLAASDAAMALDLISHHAGEIQLLFSDVGLPGGVDGFQLSARLRQLRPHLRTILCSGFVDSSLKTRMAQEGIEGFVPKPYEFNFLLQTIRSVLDQEKRQPAFEI